MASNPPGKCCTMGYLHEGTPRGDITELAGVSTYIVHPSAGPSKKIVYLLTDIFGHKFRNPQLLADGFAISGYTTIVPDLFNGDPAVFPIPPGFVLGDWLKKHQPEHVQPIVDRVLAALRQTFAPEAVGAVGYCFGGKYVARLLGKTGQPDGVNAGYTAHPSFVTMEELEGVKGPLSIAAAETDSIFTQELRHASEKKLTEIGALYQINLYSNTQHGFATRGKDDEAYSRFAKEQAFHQAVAWFEAFL